ncbi:MAG: DUF481 domain-containing protein [Planctomycetota bacterium]|nr:DUF481 domain-containing protein [Planctomycetota bacterium]
MPTVSLLLAALTLGAAHDSLALEPIDLGPLLQDEAAPQEEEQWPKWTASASLGFTLSDGNSETIDLAALFDAGRRAEKDRWTLGFFWNFGQKTEDGDTDVTTRDYGGKLKYDYFVDEKLYYLANFSAKRDDPAGIQTRWIAGIGVGRQFREEEDFSFSGEVGASYVSEDLVGESPNGYVAGRLASTLGYRFNGSTRLDQTAELLPSIEDSEDFISVLDSRLKVSMSERLSLMLQHVWDYNNSPASGAHHSDNRLLVTFSWSL